MAVRELRSALQIAGLWLKVTRGSESTRTAILFVLAMACGSESMRLGQPRWLPLFLVRHAVAYSRDPLPSAVGILTSDATT